MSTDWAALIEMQEGQPDTDDDLMPDGIYDVECVAAKHGSTATDDPKLIFKTRLQVISGIYKGRVLFHNMVVSPDSDVALAVFFRQLYAYGMDQKFMAEMPALETMEAKMRGSRIAARIGVDEFMGARRNVVVALYPERPSAPVSGRGERA